MAKHRSGVVAPSSNSGAHRLAPAGPRRVTTVAAAAVAGTAALSLGTPATAMAQTLPPSAIAHCESGGNIRAQNPSSTASGKWQFIDSTWRAYGGGEFASRAKHATEREQDIVAARAYAAEGTSPWNASKGCWGGKSRASGEVAKPVKQAPPKKAEPKKAAKPKPAEKTQVIQKVTPKAAPKVVPAGAKYTPGGTGSYTVKRGDTLTMLAVQNGQTVAKLVDLNKDIIEHKDWLFAGERLHLK